MNIAEARGILIASVMEADGNIRRAEVETGAELVRRVTPDHQHAEEVWMEAILATDLLPLALNMLVQLPVTERQQIIADLWAMSDSDEDISHRERGVIVKIAAALGVSPGKGNWPDRLFEVN
jgi:uncharacterized tellurite resistance protein B-like protein